MKNKAQQGFLLCLPLQKEDAEMKCVKCGSENVLEGKLSTGMGGLVFTTAKAQPRLPFTRNDSTLIAKGCKDCGAVFDIRMETPKALREEE